MPYSDIDLGQHWFCSGKHENLYQHAWMIVLAIFVYIAYVYNEFFTHLNGILVCQEQVFIDFVDPVQVMACCLTAPSHYLT